MAEAVTTPRKRGLWQRMSEFDSRRPLLWDLVPIAFYALILLPPGLLVADEAITYPVVQLAAVVLFMVPLRWRRRFPFAVIVSQLAPTILMYAFDLSEDAGAWPTTAAAAIAAVLALYNLVLRSRLVLLWPAAGIAAAPMILGWVIDSPGSALAILGEVVQSAFFFGFVVMVAFVVRTRRSFQRSLQERVANEAVLEERGRIAREMHDIIGHNLAVINALADGGAYAAAASPERAKEALTAIGSTSRQALSELRRVLHVLQDDDRDAELAPQPGLAELESLIERVRDAGLPVVVRTSGERWDLSENQQLAVYRTVQEALTNVLKHVSGPRRADVSLEYREDGLSVVVANTGSIVDDTGTPRGLAGLAERAAAFGGTMVAGPQSIGGWRVALWMPKEKERT